MAYEAVKDLKKKNLRQEAYDASFRLNELDRQAIANQNKYKNSLDQANVLRREAGKLELENHKILAGAKRSEAAEIERNAKAQLKIDDEVLAFRRKLETSEILQKALEADELTRTRNQLMLDEARLEKIEQEFEVEKMMAEFKSATAKRGLYESQAEFEVRKVAQLEEIDRLQKLQAKKQELLAKYTNSDGDFLEGKDVQYSKDMDAYNAKLEKGIALRLELVRINNTPQTSSMDGMIASLNKYNDLAKQSASTIGSSIDSCF